MKKHFYKSGDYLNAVEMPQGSAKIYKRVHEKPVQINEYHLKEGYTLYFQPPKNKDGLKSYYILSGSVEAFEDKRICCPGDLVLLNFEDEPYHIKVISDTKVLVHSIHEDSFTATKNNFHHIYKVLTKIHEKDSYTLDHSYQVHQLVEKMGLALGYSGNRMLNLLLAAQYHDIGKINIPDHILNKPGRLTDDEFTIMKSHVVEGKDLIMENFSEDVYQIIVQHHERVDGSGYPLGIKGNRICQEAKILAICDSYDAMISQRIYKKPKSKEEALKELQALKGLLYDSKLVDLFMTIV
jgi:putative nucleotidyltransferase with HDIG domain